ncbi:MAG TPA: hypothetical protein ENK99_02395 [Campylobacterales bacterium]|nr:hypothetical protein [Campylobacterales bacterium]
MGTLYNQPPRDYTKITISDKNHFFEEVKALSKKHKMTTDEIINGLKILELRRRNDLFVNNGDIYDEQIAGIGHEFQDISSSLREIAESIKYFFEKNE